MIRLRVGVPVLAALLAGGWLLGDDKKDDKKPDDPPVKVVKGKLPANFSKLGLTDVQKREIYKIRAGYEVKIDALKQKIADLHDEEKDEVEKVLTDTQKARLKEIRLGEKTKDKGPRNI